MPTIDQLAQRLQRLNRQLAAKQGAGAEKLPSGSADRPLRKARRRVQRKLRMRRPGPPVPTGKSASPPSAAPGTPPAEAG